MLNLEKERFIGNIVLKRSFQTALMSVKNLVYDKFSRQNIFCFINSISVLVILTYYYHYSYSCYYYYCYYYYYYHHYYFYYYCLYYYYFIVIILVLSMLLILFYFILYIIVHITMIFVPSLFFCFSFR